GRARRDAGAVGRRGNGADALVFSGIMVTRDAAARGRRLNDGDRLKPAGIASDPVARSARMVATWIAGAVLLLTSADGTAQSALSIDSIRLPPGFTIEVLARVPSARAMT